MTELVSSLDNLHRIFSGRTVVLRSIDMLSIEDRRTALRYLLDAGVTAECLGPSQDCTGLPQKLRGAIHALTRNYAPNLIADAVMLEVPEEQRQEVAKAFLPKKPLHEKLEEQRAEKEAAKAQLYVVVDAASGEELGKVHPDALTQHLRIRDRKTGDPVDYIQSRIVHEYDFREKSDAAPRMLALYRRAGAE